MTNNKLNYLAFALCFIFFGLGLFIGTSLETTDSLPTRECSHSTRSPKPSPGKNAALQNLAKNRPTHLAMADLADSKIAMNSKKSLAELQARVSELQALNDSLNMKYQALSKSDKEKRSEQLESLIVKLRTLAPEVDNLEELDHRIQNPTTAEERAAQGKITPFFMQLARDRNEVLNLLLVGLKDPKADRDVLLWLFQMFSNEMAGPEIDSKIRIQAMKMALMEKQDSSARRALLKSAFLDGHSPDDIANAVALAMEFVSDSNLAVRREALTLLARSKQARARGVIQTVLRNPLEDSSVLQSVLGEYVFSDEPEDLNVLLEILQNKTVRRFAYRKLFLSPRNNRILRALEGLYREEQSPRLGRLLRARGDQATVAFLQTFSENPNYSGEVREGAKLVLADLKARLAK